MANLEGYNNIQDEAVRAIGTRFREVINLAVVAHPPELGRPFFTDPRLKAISRLSLGDIEIAFKQFTGYQEFPDNTSVLNFAPRHAAEVVHRHTFFGRTTSQTTFALRKDGAIVRQHMYTPASASVTRELDLEESVAIVDFLTSPHLYPAQLEVAMRFTEEEQAQIQARLADEAVMDQRLEASFRESDRARGHAAVDAQMFVIGHDIET